jgi:hypothetical protein
MDRIRCLLLLAALAAGSAVGCARHGYVGRVPPPPPPPHAYRAPGRPPGPGWVWVEGHWSWRGNHWHWVRGHWARVR